MESQPPFRFPTRNLDGLREALARIEHGSATLVRRLRAGQVRSVLPWRGPRLFSSRLESRSEEATRAQWGGSVILLPAIPWRYRFQRPQQLARALAAFGHPVLYVDAFRRSHIQPAARILERRGALHVLRLKIPGNIDLYRQVPTEEEAREAAAVLAEGIARRPLLILVQHPSWTPLALTLRDRFGVPLIYDLIDLHSGFPGIPDVIGMAELQLLEVADAVSATSTALAERASSSNRNVTLCRNAVALEDFPLVEHAARPQPVLAYVGALSDWFDVQAIEELARSRDGWRLRLAGRVESTAVAKLDRLPGVELIGEIPYDAVATLLSTASATLIPFRTTPLTSAVDPVKVYESLATGLPIIATRLPETEIWEEPFVYLADEPRDFPEQARRALAEDSEEIRRLRRSRVLHETWSRRAADLLSLARGL